ncbi:uncharacterized protein LOC144699999 [Wolffia australiana]
MRAALRFAQGARLSRHREEDVPISLISPTSHSQSNKDDEEDDDDPEEEEEPRWARADSTRSDSESIFRVLLQEGPGFSARLELDKLGVPVSPDLVRAVLLLLIRHVTDSNKPRCAKLGLKFFMWAGDRPTYRHTSAAFNLTLKLFSKCDETKAMWRLLDEMLETGLPTTALTFRTLVAASGAPGSARRLVEKFIQSKSFNFRPFKSSFNAILHSLVALNQYHLIEWVHQRMLQDGHSPDVLTFNVLLCAKYRLGKLDQFHGLLDEMGKSGLSPDLHTYNIILHVLGKGDKPLAALKLLNYMKDVGCVPSVLHFTSLIDGLGRAGNLPACQYFFDEMVRSGCEPDVVCYTVMLSGYAVAGEVDTAQKLFDEMVGRGRSPNVFTYGAMVRGLCLGGEYERACSMLRQVEEKGCVPASSVYRVMVAGLRSAGKDSEAEEIILRMEQKGLYPRLSARFRAYRRS